VPALDPSADALRDRYVLERELARRLWYTMPYVEGESLRDRLRREIQLPIEEATRLAREVADVAPGGRVGC
jgi:serine/threonine protein kinase